MDGLSSSYGSAGGAGPVEVFVVRLKMTGSGARLPWLRRIAPFCSAFVEERR